MAVNQNSAVGRFIPATRWISGICDEASIIKNGISAAKRKTGARGVHAIPVLANFTTTHQLGQRVGERFSALL